MRTYKCEDYYDLEQVLDEFKKIHTFFQPKGLPQLISECRKNEIEPVFHYSGDIILDKKSTHLEAYLTNINLNNLISKEKEAFISDAVIYEFLNCDIKFMQKTEVTFESIKVVSNELLFPAKQIDEYVNKFNEFTNPILRNEELESEFDSLNKQIKQNKKNQKNLSKQLNEKNKLLTSKIKEIKTLKENLIKEKQQIEKLMNELDVIKSEKKPSDKSKSMHCLIAMQTELLLDRDVDISSFKSKGKDSDSKPSQEGLAEYINDLNIKNLSSSSIKKIFSDANKYLKDAKKQ